MDREAREKVAALVGFVAHREVSVAAICTSRFADALEHAIAAGCLIRTDNVLRLADDWTHLSSAKDPEGEVLNTLAVRALFDDRDTAVLLPDMILAVAPDADRDHGGA
jgi:hypothetical protein